MLTKLLIIENDSSIQSFGYDDSGSLIYKVIEEKESAGLEAIYKVRINSLNKRSRFAYVDYAPNLQGILNIKNTNVQPGSNLLSQLIWQGDGVKLPKFSQDIKLLGKYVIVLPNETRHFFSKNLKSSLNQIIEKYLDIGIIFRSSIDEISDYKLIEDEIGILIKRANLLEIWVDKPVGQLTTPNYKFMQLLREARLSKIIEIHTNSAYVSDYLMPYVQLWQLNTISLDKSLSAKNVNEEELPKTYAQFDLEIHKLSGINLIDINSKNSPLSFYQVNYLAIDEIVRQIWLQDLTGIILLDFIKNMSTEEKQKLMLKLTKHLHNDWRKNQVLGFTKSGICEIIRNK